MEKVNFYNSRGLRLSGVLHIPDIESNSIIIMCHGFTGDKDEWGVFSKAASRFCDTGFSVFRFDFGGSGESEDAPITVENEVDDLKSALAFVKSRGYKKPALLGFSMGGLISVLVYNKLIETMILWAPVTKSKTPTFLLEDKFRKELEDKGYIVISNSSGKQFRIKKQYLEEREAIDQEKILSVIDKPVLILHGENDEIVPNDHSKSALQYLPKGSKLEIIPNGDHGFKNNTDLVISLSLNWFKESSLSPRIGISKHDCTVATKQPPNPLY